MHILLDDLCAILNAAALANVANAELDQIASTEFAVDGEVEQRQPTGLVRCLQMNANAPDILRFERRFLPY